MPVKFYIYAAIALALAGVLWHDHYLSRQLKKARVETTEQRLRADQAEIQVKAEQEARANEQRINRQIDQQLLAANQALDAERRKPLPRLRCRLQDPSAHQAGSGSTASSVGNAAGEGNDGQADAGDFDPSEALMQFAIEAQQNRDGWQACQDWIRATQPIDTHQ